MDKFFWLVQKGEDLPSMLLRKYTLRITMSFDQTLMFLKFCILEPFYIYLSSYSDQYLLCVWNNFIHIENERFRISKFFVLVWAGGNFCNLVIWFSNHFLLIAFTTSASRKIRFYILKCTLIITSTLVLLIYFSVNTKYNIQTNFSPCKLFSTDPKKYCLVLNRSIFRKPSWAS